MSGPQAIPAATLIVLRPNGAECEVLMIERAGGLVFAAGAMVFPGGRIDPGDRRLAETLLAGSDPLQAAARVAAIRETIEEVGIGVGLVPTPDQAAVARVRAGLAAGTDLAKLLQDEGLRLDPAALTPFARWRPESGHTRTFDTFFFVAAAPDDAVATPDGGESVHAVWASARTLLQAADAGQYHIIFPTRRNLERLARYGSLDDIAGDVDDRAFETITPWVEERGGRRWLCIPDDRGYPVTAELLETVSRG